METCLIYNDLQKGDKKLHIQCDANLMYMYVFLKTLYIKIWTWVIGG